MYSCVLVVALSLVMGGAVGNFTDRIRFDYVVDFLDFYIGKYKWPTFNVADIAISIGVGLIFLDMILDAIRRKKAKQEDVQSEVTTDGDG